MGKSLRTIATGTIFLLFFYWVTLTAASAASSPLTISTSKLPQGTVGASYTESLAATGGTSPYTWSITTGRFPAGLSLDANTGTISGTPTTSGNYSFGVKVTDSSSATSARKDKTATATVTLSVAAASTPALAITTSTLPSGTKGTSYSSALTASGGTTPYTWSITSGSLPAGLTLTASTGLISGTPTATGTSKFTVRVMDAGSPAKTKSVSLSLVVAGPTTPALTITTSSMPAGTQGASYSSALQASGGTTPYSWSITGGALPAGLTMASTGLISGTPTANGTASFTVTVTDSSSPAQTKSATLSIVVAAAAPSTLTINATLPAGTVGTAYSSAMSASGGTPAYTWSITAGSLPAGLTLAASSGTISGTPSASGTFSFTATVTDSGTPTAQMQSAQTSIVVATAQTTTGPGTTWYIRPDGGTRYSANTTTGQCDGQADTAYSGSGTNQHCAFNDYRFLYDDQSYQNSAWVIAGGDTVIIRGGPYRVGVEQGTVPATVWCAGTGNPYGCTNPTIPAGTPTQPTRILGENYGSCNQTNMTQLHGGFGVESVLNLAGASNVAVECIEITDYAQCSRVGATPYPSACSTSYPIDDYATEGIVTNTSTSNVLLQDMNIHGLTDYGLLGPIGGLITMNRVRVAYNAFAGWDFDDGNATPDAPGSLINASYVTMEWNGCNEEYPIVDPNPAISCYDDNSGGFGDAWSAQGTGSGGQISQLSMTCNYCIIRYNTKDGFGMNHITFDALSITNSTAYGNMGQQWKWSAYDGANITFTNNVVVGNCARMSNPISGAPTTFNTYLSDFCRASGDNIALGVGNGGTTLLAFNTVVGYAATTFDIDCLSKTSTTCSTSSVISRNNVLLGYYSSTYNSGQDPGAYYMTSGSQVLTRDHNLYFNQRNDGCPSTGFTGEICADPLLVNEPTGNGGNFVESELDNFNFALTPGSPAVGAGVAISGITTDSGGNTRPTPPAIGALEP